MLSCSLLASKVAYSFHLFAYKNFYSNICFPSRILPVSFRFSKIGLPYAFPLTITLPNRLTQLDILLLCNHIVHDIRLSFLFQWSLPQGERPC